MKVHFLMALPNRGSIASCNVNKFREYPNT